MLDLSEINLPDLADPLFAEFWDGMLKEELRIQYCPESGIHYWPPRLRCSKSGSTKMEWIKVAPKGTLYSFVVVRQSMIKGYQAPYVIGLITLDEHPSARVVGVIHTDGPDTLTIGMAVSGVFVAAGKNSDAKLLHWT